MATKGNEQELSDLTPPDFEGGHETSYIFIRGLGSGAFAEANLYRKIEDNSLVVWKEINMARLGDKEKRDAVNEIDILSLLNHANVITYYNHFLDGETLLIELEYANGGTLAQKIDKQNELFQEEVVKWYLFQLTSALAHCHEHGIIHRDVKCLNIFMTKTDLLKLGDFGISKVLESSSKMAETVAGTPLYMSPEIMQGAKYWASFISQVFFINPLPAEDDYNSLCKQFGTRPDAAYDYKTDIWALGCVLYELLTLTRTFQGTNHLRLAYEIVCGQHGSVDSRFSKGIRDLVDTLLKKNPADRPSAQEVIDSEVLSNRSILEKRVYELNTGARRARIQTSVSVIEQTVVPVVKSKVTEVYQWGGGKLVPQKQDIFVKGRSPAQVSAGHSHFAVVTMEKEVYTWANLQGGDKIVGQLGHGNTAGYKTPKKVEAFEGVGIIQTECGEDFTICVSDEGQVYSFGSDFYGCLGCDNEEGDEVASPVCIDMFRCCPVQEVSCGDNHVVAVTKDGDVYTWGCGEFGRLGLGSEDDFTSPQKVQLKKRHLIKHVSAGCDGTMLLTTTGRVLASGSNEYNKLGFNSETSGLKKHKPKVYDIPCKVNFTLVRPLMRLNVVSIATGASHSAVIDVCGHLHTFGCNKFGQLGVGDFKEHSGILRVPGVLVNHRVEKVTCGDGYTVASTSDNYVYAWGNGENGRLGTGQMDLGKGPNNKSVSIPRPIFGALHIVPHLSARHWHTILIAEKVLNQKTLKTRGSMPKMKLHSDKKVGLKEPGKKKVSLSNIEGSQNVTPPNSDSAFSNDEQSENQTDDDVTSSIMSGDSGKPTSPDGSRPFSLVPKVASPGVLDETNEDSLPPWLEAELEDDVIPVPAGFVIQSPGAGPYPAPNVTPDGFQWQPTPLPQIDIPSSSPVADLMPQTTQNDFKSGIFVPSNSNQGVILSPGSGSPSIQVKDDKDKIIEELLQRVTELELENKKMQEHYEAAVESLKAEVEQLRENTAKVNNGVS